eukprot:TRINITY_DN104916_c0_g1_i1.p1 TRINITY_DN104916_c0_g1~~TRINITY_DN104916_c0_g1_i1.p1  ORF type:complete len:288 (+),score=41.72 TRINITY_DN104916_c0_g1_i1:139-1002(+)
MTASARKRSLPADCYQAAKANRRPLKRFLDTGVAEEKPDLAEEIKVHTTWAEVLGGSAPLGLEVRQLYGEEVWLVDGLLSPDECRALVRKSEEHGYGPTDFVKSYRGNLRLTAMDKGLSEAIWQRLEPLVPARVRLKAPPVLSEASWWSSYPDVDGKWEACGLNSCWRLAKYHPGDQFQVHCDGAFEKEAGSEMSMLTANIYLNEDFEGGLTRFWLNDDPYFEWRDTFGVPDFEVSPKVGSCLIFRQPPGRTYWHDGEAVRAGLKYLLRSDVMYRRSSRRSRGPNAK